MSTRALRESAAALSPLSLGAAVEAFLAAHAASEEAWSNLTRAQACGPDPVPAEAEYLRDEAGRCWDLLATGWAEHLIPAEARDAGVEYARPKLVHAPVVRSDPLDWSQARGEAA